MGAGPGAPSNSSGGSGGGGRVYPPEGAVVAAGAGRWAILDGHDNEGALGYRPDMGEYMASFDAERWSSNSFRDSNVWWSNY